MAALPEKRYTAEEYLNLERKAEYKSEFFKGEIFAMAGASYNHNLICDNVAAEFHAFFKQRKTCRHFSGDMRLHIPENTLYTYPDLMVICGKKEFLDETELDTLLNPVLIVEVLSESTAQYDRVEKFSLYRSIPTFREYVLIDSYKRYSVEKFYKNEANIWEFTDSQDLENGLLTLQSLDLKLTLKDIYLDVENLK